MSETKNETKNDEQPSESVVVEKQEEKVEDNSSKNGDDLYGYLERDNYTTEKYKIEVRGLPKYYGLGEFRKYLNEKLQLDASKVKPPKRGGGWAYICFRSEENREKAITALNGAEWKKSKLMARVSFIVFIKLNI